MGIRFAPGCLPAMMLMPLISEAASVTYRARGTVIAAQNAAGLLPSASIGDPMSITYVLDDTIGGDAPDAPWDWIGEYYNAVRSMTVDINGNSFTLIPAEGDHSRLLVLNDATVNGGAHRDTWYASVGVGLATSSSTRFESGVSVISESQSGLPTLLTADDYLLFPDLSKATRSSIDFTATTYVNGSYVFNSISGSMMDLAPVPLPGAVWLLLSGIGMMGLARRTSPNGSEEAPHAVPAVSVRVRVR